MLTAALAFMVVVGCVGGICAQGILSFFPFLNNGAEAATCDPASGRFPLPDDYTFSLPAWDPDPANRQQTRDPNATPGPVPENYDNRGKTVPYLSYLRAAQTEYNIPWYMLAAISWQETRHGSDPSTWDRDADDPNDDHSYGPMQFIPGTFQHYATKDLDDDGKLDGDGDGDGKASDESVGDLIFAAANLLARNGFGEGQAGVLRAIDAYNPHPWYVNDVLFWAEKYASGAGDSTNITTPLCVDASADLATVVKYVRAQVGKPYVFSAEGPDAFDCSGLMFAGYRRVGVTLPHNAAAQADSKLVDLIARHPVDPSVLMPGDLLFYDNGASTAKYSQRLSRDIGHVSMYVGQLKNGNYEIVQASSPSTGVVLTEYTRADFDQVTAVGRVKGMLGTGAWSGRWAAPVRGAIPTSPFGMRTLKGVTKLHAGVDLAAPQGTPIYAVADGTVVFAGPANGYGNYVLIDHGGGHRTGYGHMETINRSVRVGAAVKRGQVIAGVGEEGRSTGYHLHFETIKEAYGDAWSGVPMDPQPILIGAGVNYWG